MKRVGYVIVGILLVAASFYIGLHILGLSWYQVPLYVVFDYTFTNGWYSVLSFVNEFIFFGGIVLAGIGIFWGEK